MMESFVEETYHPNKVLVFVAKILSYAFHPLFIPTYIFLFLGYQFPMEFAGLTDKGYKLKLFGLFWMTAFFPAFAVFLMWRLKFIDNIFLRTQKERIIPFFVSMFFYWWMYYLGKNFKDQPEVLKFFFFGIFISTSIGVIINNYIKISLHGMAMGGALTAIVLFSFYYQTSLGLPIIIATIITGLVATSRFIAGSHTNTEMYGGLILGCICQLVAYWVVM
ncbi:MAG: hypothetical protein MUE72_03345 [Chitinophagaceae bacterium]|jgi:hypothetical protein|nr:hypothetical protein [Chitinophagaceae bacterium]